MRTRNGKVYDPIEPNTDMNPNASSSGITSPIDYATLEILKTVEEIKAQMNTLGQKMDMLDVESRDGGHNERVNSTNAERRESIRIKIDTMMMNDA